MIVAPASPRAEVGIACAAAALAVVAAIAACGGSDILAGRPLKFEGDAVLHAVVARIAIDDRWTWHGSRFGAPTGFPLAAFGLQLPVETAIMKLVALATDDPISVLNGTWLILVGIAAIEAYAACRLLGLGRTAAFVCGTLFAASPHAYLRNVTHLNLHAAFVPVPTALALLTAGGRIADLDRRTFLAACGATGLAAIGYVYYPFFYAIVFAIALLVASLAGRRHSLRRGLACLAVIIAGGSANLIPTVMARAAEGPLAAVDYKRPEEADTYGLRLRDLVMPSGASRIPPLAAIGRRIEAVAWPLRGESRHAKLGLVATVGVVVALAALVGWRPPAGARGLRDLRAAACLIVGLLLVAVPGGLGSIVNTFITPEFRCYNRLVTVISFLGLAALGTWLSSALARLPRPAARAAWLMVLACGLIEQDVAAAIRTRSTETSLERQRLATFVDGLEASLPRGGRIWMLPPTEFPVDRGSGAMREFDHAKPGLLSHELTWSWPAFGFKATQLAAEIGDGTTAGSVVRARAAGFTAAWVDAAGAPPAVAATIRAIERAGGRLLQQSPDGRYRVYDLAPVAGVDSAPHPVP